MDGSPGRREAAWRRLLMVMTAPTSPCRFLPLQMNRPIQVKPADSESRGGKRRPSSDTSDTETSVQPGTFASVSDGDFGPAKIKPCDLHAAAAARGGNDAALLLLFHASAPAAGSMFESSTCVRCPGGAVKRGRQAAGFCSFLHFLLCSENTTLLGHYAQRALQLKSCWDLYVRAPDTSPEADAAQI